MTGQRAWSSLLTVAGFVGAVLVGVPAWVCRHWRYTALVVAAGVVAYRAGWVRVEVAAVALLLLPALVAVGWARCWPFSFERLAAGPWRGWGWRRWVRRSWPTLARECGLSVQRKTQRREVSVLAGERGRRVTTSTDVPTWVHPRLAKVRTSGNTLTLTVRTRTGQTVDDLERAAAPLAAAACAVSWRTKALSTSVLELGLVMREALASARLAPLPTVVEVDSVGMGRRQDDTDWRLQLRGRHTLVAGCSGSGKGSMLWGICGGLAPAVAVDLVRLWGVDLKRGVEISIGAPLFSTIATRPSEALTVLTRLLEVVEVRGRSMAGVTRLHQPTPGDPLHVLVIDELAALLAYADPDTRREANRLLSEVLTQGRALGVVVVACVQDPRKETVGMRGLFTQTIALRLRGSEETRMVLGDGMAALAPAHRLSPDAPGSAWLVEDDGHADRVRADYWTDHRIRQAAAVYPAPGANLDASPTQAASGSPAGPQDSPPPQNPSAREAGEAATVTDLPTGQPPAARPRRPRAPRKPRAARPADREDDGDDGVDTPGRGHDESCGGWVA